MTGSPVWRLGAACALATSLAAQPQLTVPQSVPKAAMAMPQAAAEPTAADLEARAFQRPLRGGEGLARAVRKVNGQLHWHDDLDEALRAAADQGKPLVWIQALGSLSGFV